MKNSILITFLFISNLIFGQLPINENFNTQPTTWTMTNGAGYQNNSGNYWLTTNIGNTPYPNAPTSPITMTSPVYNLSSCVGTMNVKFLLNGIIENGYDYMYFEYKNNLGVWVTVQSFTGLQSNVNITFTIIPNTATQFRFRLVTNGSVNSYCTNGFYVLGFWFCTNSAVYFYDIDNFQVTCNAYLPIELLSFNGVNKGEGNLLTWTTASEQNNDYFTIERSDDGINWSVLDTIKGSGNSQQNINYSMVDSDYRNVINYYRLKQTDFDGQYELFEKIVAIDNRMNQKKIVKITNLLGQEIDENYRGVVIELYEDNTVSTKIR